MRIGLVILHADPMRGGAERYTADLADQLTRRGHGVALLAASFGAVGAEIEQVPLAFHGVTRVKRYRRFLSALDAHLSQANHDIVHAMLPVRQCDVYHPHAGVAAAAASRGGWHLLNRRRQLFGKVERDLLTGPRPVVTLCLSQRVRSVVREHYPALPDARVPVLFNGTDLARFDPARQPDPRVATRAQWGLDDRHVVALILAQDFARKGVRQAIEALAQTGDPRLVLCVGGRDNATPYERLARSLGIANRVRFLGPVADAPAAYRAADAFVLPTRHDPCSLVVLEALCMGVPVVSTAVNGACEAMSDGLHGRVLNDPSDVVALANAMRELTDDQRRATMAAACLTLRPTLSQAAHVDQLLAIYGSIKADSPRRHGVHGEEGRRDR